MASAEAQIAHIWRRLGFGPGPGDIAAGLVMGPQNLIVDLCARTPTTIADWDWPQWQPGDAWEEWQEYGRFQDRIIEQFARSPNPLQERISWILMGLLVISQTDQLHYPDFKKYTNLIKQHALGSYHTLLREVTLGSGMQWYLNGFENRVGHANENLARELMELFALGIADPVTGQPNYSELDVKEMARALTGYQYNWTTGEADFNATEWDPDDKSFLGAARGAADIDQVMQAIDQQPAYRRFIAQRLYRQIVGLEPEPAVIDSLAAAFGPGCNLQALVTAIAQRPEFLSDAAIRARVKCPMELVAATLRALDLYQLGDFNFAYSMSFLGQHLFNAPNVNGWPQGRDWLHAGQAIHWSTHAREMSTRDDGEGDVPAARRSSTVRALHAAGGALDGAGRAALALQALGLYDVSPATAAAMATFATGGWSHERAAALLCLGLNSPEFYLQ
jgi:uncharacterized protein (DUF1800 family)